MAVPRRPTPIGHPTRADRRRVPHRPGGRAPREGDRGRLAGGDAVGGRGVHLASGLGHGARRRRPVPAADGAAAAPFAAPGRSTDRREPRDLRPRTGLPGRPEAGQELHRGTGPRAALHRGRRRRAPAATGHHQGRRDGAGGAQRRHRRGAGRRGLVYHRRSRLGAAGARRAGGDLRARDVRAGRSAAERARAGQYAARLPPRPGDAPGAAARRGRQRRARLRAAHAAECGAGAARRLVRLRAAGRPHGAGRRDPRVPGRRDHGDLRAVGLRQEHAGGPPAGPAGTGERRGAGGRRPARRREPTPLAAFRRLRAAGALPVSRHDSRQPRVGAPGCDR